jgi:putative phosphoesterase
MRVAIISDTHLPRGRRRLSERCLEAVRASDLVLHAGDICSRGALEELRRIGPLVHAIHGNVDEPDLQRELAPELTLELEGARLTMLHDAGPERGRLERLHERFRSSALVIFGHSHLPLHELSQDGFQIFNPGSPTERRRAPQCTMGLATISAGEVTLEHIAV